MLGAFVALMRDRWKQDGPAGRAWFIACTAFNLLLLVLSMVAMAHSTPLWPLILIIVLGVAALVVKLLVPESIQRLADELRRRQQGGRR